MAAAMNLNKIVFKFVRFSFSILVMLLVVVCLVKLGTFCYEFGYRVFTEAPMEYLHDSKRNDGNYGNRTRGGDGN